jgi:16S rRNA (cytosine967-C5)-methyltransferase
MKRKPKPNCDPVRLAAFKVLCDFERSPSPLPELMESHLMQGSLTDLDRSFVSHLVYGVIRYKEQLDFVIKRHVTEKGIERRRQKSALLRLGAFQLMPDSKVPQSAAINETVKLTRSTVGEGLTGFVNAVLRKIAANSVNWDRLIPGGDTVNDLSIRYSQPEWLVNLLVQDHGIEDAVRFLSAFYDRLDTSVRINHLKITPNQFEERLRKLDIPIARSEISDDYYILPPEVNKSLFEPLKKGECFVQNVSSGIVTDLLSPASDDRILDMCAAPGGKTATITLMTGRPENITSIEVDRARTEIMRQNLIRLGLDRVRIKIGDGRLYSNSGFDSILVDAPCSGLGTLAKHPEIKYTQNLQNIENLAAIQIELLNNAVKLLKPDGILLYSVCTLSNRETVDVKDEFLKSNPNFVLDVPVGFQYHQFVRNDGTLVIPPGENNLEGMFTFRARKAG